MTPKGEIVIWDKVSHACKEVDITVCNIYVSIRQNGRTKAGFFFNSLEKAIEFRMKNLHLRIPYRNYREGIKVRVTNRLNKKVSIYGSIKSASISTGVNQSSLSVYLSRSNSWTNDAYKFERI